MALSTSTSTLAAGASRTFNLSPGSALTLVAPPNVRATVTETPNTVSASDVGGNASRTHDLQMVQTVTYGPYPMGGTVVVANASNSGATITWVRSDSIVAESAAGAVSLVDGDGMPFISSAQKNGMWQGGNIGPWQTSFANYCWRLATELPGHARAFRVAVPKAVQGTWTVDAIAVCATDTATNPARFSPGAGAPWVVGTFDGVATAKTIPALVPPAQWQTNLPGDIVWSDWMYCQTIPRVDDPTAKPMVVLSVYSASTNTACINGGTGSDVAFGSEPMRRFDAFKAAQSNAVGSFSSGSSDPQCLPIAAFQWMPVDPSFSLGAFGDSIMQGGKTTPMSRGYVIRTAALLTANGPYKVSSVNAAAGGDRVISCLNRFRFYCQAGGGLPNMAMFPIYSRNSTSSMSVDQMAGVAEVFIKTALQYGVLPVLVTAIPETATPANNATAAAANLIAADMASYYQIPLIDAASVITLANADTLLDADGIHPNNAGDDAIADLAATTLAPWVCRAMAVSKFR